jgi:hypothetical protein
LLYYIRLHSGIAHPANCDVVGPFPSMAEAYAGSQLISGANEDEYSFSFVSETVRARDYDAREMMPLAYYC